MACGADVDKASYHAMPPRRGRLAAFVVQARTRSADSRSRRSGRQVCFRACAIRFGMPLEGGCRGAGKWCPVRSPATKRGLEINPAAANMSLLQVSGTSRPRVVRAVVVR